MNGEMTYHNFMTKKTILKNVNSKTSMGKKSPQCLCSQFSNIMSITLAK